MKRLEELGISPVPWTVSDAQNYWIEDANRKMVCDGLTYRGNDESADAEEHSNARLIAAAPEMYAALWDLCFGESKTVNCVKCGGNDHGDGIEHCSKTCPFYKYRAALAKASEESEAIR